MLRCTENMTYLIIDICYTRSEKSKFLENIKSDNRIGLKYISINNNTAHEGWDQMKNPYNKKKL